MNKIERVRAALAGQPVDRPPFTVWYHFGNQHAPAERTAQVHLEFFEHYDLDLLKLMNDYDYPMPEGMEVIATPADLARLKPFDPADTPFGTQLRTVEIVAGALRGKALFLDTVFNAWNTLKRNLVREAMPTLMAQHPQAVEAALGVVNANLIRYAQASLARGAAGIFLSVPATSESLTSSNTSGSCGPSISSCSRPFAARASATCSMPTASTCTSTGSSTTPRRHSRGPISTAARPSARPGAALP